ncbi:MAG: HipA domain-containing protein [Bacilli bacterium]
MNIDEIFSMSGSTGGERPKAHLTIDGKEWIVKFREREDTKWMGRMEYEYNMAAKKCGIEVADFSLLPSKICEGYFASKRFDRLNGKRIHMISLAGLVEIPHDDPVLDYVSYLQATLFICQSQEEVIKAFRLACFNVFAKTMMTILRTLLSFMMKDNIVIDVHQPMT